jgi:N-acetylneuraminate synthase
MSVEFKIGRRMVGDSHATYFVADIAANHDGDIERAKDLIHACAEAGGNAAKFQNFQATTLVSDMGFRALGKQQTHQSTWKKSVFEIYDDAAIPLEWARILKQTCDDAGIDYFTSLYDTTMLQTLSPYVCAWKVGSGDITWHDEIERLASDGKPLLIATGASDMHEVSAAVDAAQRHTTQIVLMQCNTNYSGSADNFAYIELNVLKTYARQFPDVVLGLSDHTPGHTTVLGAVALGARVVEKHFTDDSSREGSDHPFSMDPPAWRKMVERTRELEAALGGEEKHIMENERETIIVQRRALRATRTLPVGTVLSSADLTALRPCPIDALPPYRLEALVGKITVRTIKDGACVHIEDVK